MSDSKKPTASSPKTTKVGDLSKVESLPIPTERPWVSVLKAFNPLGPIAESYAKTLTYRLECKRLKTEVIRIKEQAALMHSAIDNSHAQIMEGLRQRRVALDRFYDTVQGQLSALHIERSMVLDIAKKAEDRMLAPDTPLAEKQLFREVLAESTALLPAFGKNANDSLAKIVEALPPVNIPQLEMPDSRS